MDPIPLYDQVILTLKVGDAVGLVTILVAGILVYLSIQYGQR